MAHWKADSSCSLEEEKTFWTRSLRCLTAQQNLGKSPSVSFSLCVFFFLFRYDFPRHPPLLDAVGILWHDANEMLIFKQGYVNSICSATVVLGIPLSATLSLGMISPSQWDNGRDEWGLSCSPGITQPGLPHTWQGMSTRWNVCPSDISSAMTLLSIGLLNNCTRH